MTEKPKETKQEESELTYDKLLDHEYDGIREYDNPLPGWWKNLFYGSILFSIVYLFYYHLGGPGLSLEQIHQADVAQAEAAMAERNKKNLGQRLGADLAAAIKDPKAIAKGKELYRQHTCNVCHRDDGGGLVGPDLTDKYWVFSPEPKEIYRVIAEGGRQGKGMNAWNRSIPHEGIIQLVAYINSLKGTNPKNPKKPASDEKKFEM